MKNLNEFEVDKEEEEEENKLHKKYENRDWKTFRFDWRKKMEKRIFYQVHALDWRKTCIQNSR